MSNVRGRGTLVAWLIRICRRFSRSCGLPFGGGGLGDLGLVLRGHDEAWRLEPPSLLLLRHLLLSEPVCCCCSAGSRRAALLHGRLKTAREARAEMKMDSRAKSKTVRILPILKFARLKIASKELEGGSLIKCGFLHEDQLHLKGFPSIR